MRLNVGGKDARYPVTSYPYCILFCNTVQYISRDITEVVYVNSFNKVSVFWLEPQADMLSPYHSFNFPILNTLVLV